MSKQRRIYVLMSNEEEILKESSKKIYAKRYPLGQTLWQYGLCFRVEELFLDSKSGGFQ